VTQASQERLFGVMSAFEHPVTVWIVSGIAVGLVITPAIIWALGAMGRITPDHRRQLWLRYAAWLALVPAMAAPVLLGAGATIVAVCVLSLLCYREFARATGLFRETLASLIVVTGMLCLTFAALDHWYAFFVAISPLVIVALLAAPIVQDRPKGYIQRVGLGALSFMLFGSCLGHLAFLANDALYRPMLLMILLTVELNDIFAYITGKAIGGPRLLANTSPNKTMAGSVGAIVLTTPLVAFLGHFVFEGSPLDAPLHLIALGLIVAVGGQLGDLVLSSVKRDIGIKDLGVAIPGHGGFLDRFDSLLLVAPAVFHYVAWVRGIGLDQPVRVFTGGGG